MYIILTQTTPPGGRRAHPPLMDRPIESILISHLASWAVCCAIAYSVRTVVAISQLIIIAALEPLDH